MVKCLNMGKILNRYIGRSLQGSETIQSIEMHIMVHSQLLFGTDSSCLQVRDLTFFIYSVD